MPAIWAEAEGRLKAGQIGTETPAAAFTLVNALLAVKPFKGNDRTTITLSANNIFDAEARCVKSDAGRAL